MDKLGPISRGEKQIVMFAVADAQRLAQLAQWRDTDLEVDRFDKCYHGNDLIYQDGKEMAWKVRVTGARGQH